jgi:glycosyltransferase involved in cell wall biosynthesis
MLAGAADVSQWVNALDQLVSRPELASSIGATAHAQYLAEHTWTRRAERLLAAAQS